MILYEHCEVLPQLEGTLQQQCVSEWVKRQALESVINKGACHPTMRETRSARYKAENTANGYLCSALYAYTIVIPIRGETCLCINKLEITACLSRQTQSWSELATYNLNRYLNPGSPNRTED